MRLWKLIGLIILISSCANEMEIKLRTLRKNNNNLPEIKRFFGLNHTWKMSSWFIKQDTTQDYNYPDLTEPCISKRNQGYEINSLNVYCTVEQLSQQELDDIHFIQGQATRIISIREHYLQRLINPLTKVKVSSSKPKLIKNNHGFRVELIHLSQESEEYYYNSAGFMAILQRENEYFIFQWFGSSIANSYLADDFIAVLKSFD